MKPIRSSYFISPDLYVPQRDEWSCGAAVYLMARAALGRSPIPYGEAVRVVGARPETGTPFDTLAEALTALVGGASGGEAIVGEEGAGRELSSYELLRNLLQANFLIVVNYREPRTGIGHFAIVQGLMPDAVILADPEQSSESVIALDQFDWRSGFEVPERRRPSIALRSH